MQEPFLGSIQYFAFNFAPRGYAVCNGATLQINQNQALFAVLGTQYGGNGTTTFMLPDLQGRTIVGQGHGAGLAAYTVGEKAGVEAVSVPLSALPVHTHTVKLQIAVNNDATGATNGDPTGAYPAIPYPQVGNMYNNTADTNVYLGAGTVAMNPAGGSQPFSLLSPYLALTCAIATVGIFPSRN